MKKKISKSLVKSFFLKISDKKEYKKHKLNLLEQKQYLQREQKLKLLLAGKKIVNPTSIMQIANTKGRLNFIHAGNAGDIIYALPVIREIGQITSVPITLYLLLDQPHNLSPTYTHPMGNVTLNKKMADMLIPLLSNLEYITSCSLYENQDIDIQLDTFRELGIWQDRGSIIRWHSYTTGIRPKSNFPWLKANKDIDFSQTIVLARSERYRNPHINYSFLSQYQNICFLGVKSEYQDIKKQIPAIKHIIVRDFLHMAEIINGAAFFIGNQSFPFSVAEGLKVPRILETSFEAPNVIPEGENGYDFYIQEHFEWFVKHLYEENIH